MKYAQLIIGLLAGTAIGGTVVASTGTPAGATADAETIKKIVREVISEEPKLIMESVQKFQMSQQKKQAEGASEAMKDSAVQEKVYNDPNAASHGPKDSKRVMAEFFDYNCGACKYMFKSIDELIKKDKTVRVVFHEYPIFGPVSEMNSKIGLAVNRLYAEKYYDFHVKMMTHEGRVDDKVAYGYAKDLGMDVEKLQAEVAKPELNAILENNRQLGDTLQIQGTPTLTIGTEVVQHALSFTDLESKLNGNSAPKKD
ncbi:MAG: DsbA family protein [Rickettsiales bacterium]